MEEGTKHITLQKHQQGTLSTHQDIVAVEEPLEIQVKTSEMEFPKAISVTMRTPGDDEELALGFLFTEGLLADYNQVKAIKYEGENIVRVYLEENVPLDLKSTERNFYTTSSCGVCGKASLEAVETISQYSCKSNVALEDSLLFSLKDKLAEEQSLFTKTGGIHAAALFDLEGKLNTLREDVGRHNALDKLIGSQFRKERLPMEDSLLMLSGRASFELVQKATMAGIGTIIAVGAPSSLAVELARKNGQRLIGFLKTDSYNIYA